MKKSTKYIGTAAVSAILTFIKCCVLIAFKYSDPFTWWKKFGFVLFEFGVLWLFFIVVMSISQINQKTSEISKKIDLE